MSAAVVLAYVAAVIAFAGVLLFALWIAGILDVRPDR